MADNNNLLLVLVLVVAVFVISGGFGSYSGASTRGLGGTFTERNYPDIQPGAGYYPFQSQPGEVPYSNVGYQSSGRTPLDLSDCEDNCLFAYGNCVTVQGTNPAICSRAFNFCRNRC